MLLHSNLSDEVVRRRGFRVLKIERTVSEAHGGRLQMGTHEGLRLQLQGTVNGRGLSAYSHHQFRIQQQVRSTIFYPRGHQSEKSLGLTYLKLCRTHHRVKGLGEPKAPLINALSMGTTQRRAAIPSSDNEIS